MKNIVDQIPTEEGNKKTDIQVMILLKYKESVPDRTKITVGFGTTGVHISSMPVLSFIAIMV